MPDQQPTGTDPLGLGADWATTAPASPVPPAIALDVDGHDRSFQPCRNQMVLRCEGVSRATGEFHPEHRDALAFMRCGSRREAVCEACAAIYRDDAYHLLREGLESADPKDYIAFFVTLTAPSFGRVHSATKDGRPTRCPCGATHRDGDGVAGAPLNPSTYRYDEAATWNASASALWHATCKRIRRAFADHEVAFIAVREMQRRGALHIHAIVRIRRSDLQRFTPATHVEWRRRLTECIQGGTDAFPTPVSAAGLFDDPAARQAEQDRRARVAAAAQEALVRPVDAPLPEAGPARLFPIACSTVVERSALRPGDDKPIRQSRYVANWGTQLDVRVVAGSGGDEASRVHAARYLAKYATKSGAGELAKAPARSPLRRHLLRLEASARELWSSRLRLDYVRKTRRVIETDAAGHPIVIEVPPIRHWERRLESIAAEFGYAGHWMTKSRGWGTFRDLRERRRQWQREQAEQNGNPADWDNSAFDLDLVWNYFCRQSELPRRLDSLRGAKAVAALLDTATDPPG